MSPDEGVVFVVSGFVALFSWWRWYAPLARVNRLGAVGEGRTLLGLAPVAAVLALFGILKTAASFDVQNAPVYLMFYVVLGAGWLGAAVLLLPVLGLNARDDVAERGNGAAAFALSGAVLGLMACFAGGNVGDGPGWWVVLFSAALATLGLALTWLVFDRITAIGDTVTIDRDRAAGLRLGGLLAGCGLILGRAVAGDWVSAAATINDFVRAGWPALVLAAAAAGMERALGPTPQAPAPAVIPFGAIPALLYLAAAFAVLLQLGPPA